MQSWEDRWGADKELTPADKESTPPPTQPERLARSFSAPDGSPLKPPLGTQASLQAGDLKLLSRPAKTIRQSSLGTRQAASYVPRDVRVRLNIGQIFEVRTTEHCFKCKFDLEASWVEKALKGRQADHKAGMIEWEDAPYRIGQGLWTPRLVLRNEVEHDEQTDERWFTIFWYDNEGNDLEWPVVCERRNSTATFAEHFELQDFPYDAQDLSITLMSARAIIVAGSTEPDSVRLKQNLNPHYVSTVDVGSFILSDEYQLYDSVICYEDITSAKNSSSKSQYALLSYSLKIVRNPVFYQLNIMVPMFFVVCMTFFSCLFKPEELGERLQVTLTLYLTAVAYKLVGADYLPKIGYTTK
jgi:hypothetical protein